MSDSATMSVRALRRADLPKLSLSIKAAATVLAIVAAVLPLAPSPEPPRRSPASCCPACRCWRCCR